MIGSSADYDRQMEGTQMFSMALIGNELQRKEKREYL